MQFQLPTELQSQLIAYDPKLKALARANEPKKTTKKSTHPLGNPHDIIPNHIVPAHEVQRAIDHINKSLASQRYFKFTKFKKTSKEENAVAIVHAVLYHYEQCWYAAWLPPKGAEDKYLYGYAYAYKDNATTWKYVPSCMKREKEHDSNVHQRAYGRSRFYIRQGLITKQDIMDAPNANDVSIRRWNIPMVPSYYQKSSAINRAISAFEQALRGTIPTWEDNPGTFERMRYGQLHHLLIPGLTEHYKDTWKPSFESFIELVNDNESDNLYRQSDYNSFVDIMHIIDKPFFRRWIQDKCDECIEKFNDPSVTLQREIKRPWLVVKKLFSVIATIHPVWPDCPIDYYQKNIEVLLSTEVRLPHAKSRAALWLNKHMPVASYFTLLNKFYEDSVQESSQYHHSYMYDNTLGRKLYRFYNLHDSFNMLANILNHRAEDDQAEEFQPPKRWRIAELHDYMQSEAWKIKNKNESLPQDLFPVPVKVTVDGSVWTLFQPIDTHQLAGWGQAVRNCVGASDYYANNCKKKKHFIVLCMVDGKPMITAQLTLEMSAFNVKQVAGIANRSLDQEQKEQFATAFKEALLIRKTQVKS